MKVEIGSRRLLAKEVTNIDNWQIDALRIRNEIERSPRLSLFSKSLYFFLDQEKLMVARDVTGHQVIDGYSIKDLKRGSFETSKLDKDVTYSIGAFVLGALQGKGEFSQLRIDDISACKDIWLETFCI